MSIYSSPATVPSGWGTPTPLLKVRSAYLAAARAEPGTRWHFAPLGWCKAAMPRPSIVRGGGGKGRVACDHIWMVTVTASGPQCTPRFESFHRHLSPLAKSQGSQYPSLPTAVMGPEKPVTLAVSSFQPISLLSLHIYMKEQVKMRRLRVPHLSYGCTQKLEATEELPPHAIPVPSYHLLS